MIFYNAKNQKHRGITGVESSIVLIAFFLVSATMAFVALSAGFTTTNDVKIVSVQGLEDASNSLHVSATIVGYASTDSLTIPGLSVVTIPIKIASTGDPQSLAEALTTIRYLDKSIEYSNIYIGTLDDKTYRDVESAFDDAIIKFSTANISSQTIILHNSNFPGVDDNPITDDMPTQTFAIVYWLAADDPIDGVLELGEHAILAIAFSQDDSLENYNKFSLELSTLDGNKLVVEREIPLISGPVTTLH